MINMNKKARISYIDLLDISLKNNMQKHQIVAVEFILSRLVGNDFSFNQTGAILADDMGTGKTLIGIAVVQAICRLYTCKSVIVCPSSLIENWKFEMKKWLPSSFGRNALFVSSSTSGGKGCDLIVNDFVTSHPQIRPVIIIGYEMFRTYMPAFNSINSIEMILCDEGHRIKNSNGTKTSLALGNFCAMRRLLMTGTPMQNNLEELYSMVQFVTPGYLGTLSDFKLKFSDIINKGKLSGASSKEVDDARKSEEILKDLLSQILMRRTKEEILTSVLPVRNEFLIYCRLSDQQVEEYTTEATFLLEGVGSNSLHNSSVLPQLTKLRQIGISSIRSEETKDNIDCIFQRSVKIEVLHHLVKNMKLIGKDKLVVVSNFTSTLDLIQSVAKLGQWGFPLLRIDGSVTADRRAKVVEHFNNPRNSFFVLLLSAKAGGVGLNLIGANRLVMMDPDWNPSVTCLTSNYIDYYCCT